MNQSGDRGIVDEKHLIISQKRYKIETQLQWNTNRPGKLGIYALLNGLTCVRISVSSEC